MVNEETQTIEYKQIWKQDCLRVIAAFANSVGGTLIIGLDDQGNFSTLSDIPKLLNDIPNTIRNKLGIIPSVELDRNETIKIKIKPSSVPISFNGKY